MWEIQEIVPKFQSRKLKASGYLRDTGIAGRKIFKYTIRKLFVAF
jgi:hypothetical protein